MEIWENGNRRKWKSAIWESGKMGVGENGSMESRILRKITLFIEYLSDVFIMFWGRYG